MGAGSVSPASSEPPPVVDYGGGGGYGGRQQAMMVCLLFASLCVFLCCLGVNSRIAFRPSFTRIVSFPSLCFLPLPLLIFVSH